MEGVAEGPQCGAHFGVPDGREATRAPRRHVRGYGVQERLITFTAQRATKGVAGNLSRARGSAGTTPASLRGRGE